MTDTSTQSVANPVSPIPSPQLGQSPINLGFDPNQKTIPNLSSIAAGVPGTTNNSQTIIKPSSQVTLPSSGQTLTPTQLANNNSYLASIGYGPDGKPLAGGSVTQTDANRPSSSASVITNNNTSSTISGAMGTQPAPTGPSTTATGLASSLSSQGINVDASSLQAYIDSGYTPSEAVQLAIQVSGINDAKTAASAATANEQTQYQQQLASENAQYGQSVNQLSTDRQNNLDTATAQLASLNSSGGISSDSSQFLSHINSQYDLAQQQLDLQAQQAKAALASGDAQAYSAIQANMANTISQVKTNVTNLLSSIQGNNVTAAQNATAEQDKAVSAYQSNLVNLPQAQDLAALPSSYGSLTPAQKTQLEGTTAYQQGIKAGYTPQSILTDVQSAATSAYKQQSANTAAQNANTAVQRAQIEAFTAETNAANKVALSTDLSNMNSLPGGSAYSAAFQQALLSVGKGLKSDDINNASFIISGFLQSGDTANASKALTNFILANKPATTKSIVSGLQDVSSYADKIKSQIAALPKDQQTAFINGTFQNIAEKFGQNPNPQLSEIGKEMGHLGLIYKAEVFGKRSAISNDATLQGLYPSITDTPSLNFATLDAMKGSANAILNGEVSSVINPDTFNAIYGDGGVLGTGNKLPQTNTTVTKSGASFDYNAAIKAGYTDAAIQSYLQSN